MNYQFKAGIGTALCCLLSACLVPHGITYKLQNTKNYEVPFTPTQSESIIYIVQPDEFVDIVLIGGAASDGIRFEGSSVFVDSRYAGNPYGRFTNGRYQFHAVCIRVKPGMHQLEIKSKETVPGYEYLTRKIKIQPNQTYVYKLDTKHGYTYKNAKIFIEEISLSQAKSYLKAMPPIQCDRFY